MSKQVHGIERECRVYQDFQTFKVSLSGVVDRKGIFVPTVCSKNDLSAFASPASVLSFG